MNYSIVDSLGYIRQSQCTTNEGDTQLLRDGERLLADNPPTPIVDYDINTEYPFRVEPIPNDAIEVPYVINMKPEEEIANNVRSMRDSKINEIMWKVERHQRLLSMELPTIDNISEIYSYIQLLCDIPEQQEFPYSVNWPIEQI